MSAAPKYPSDLGYAGLRMTAEEFFDLGETRERYELIDGVVVMSPSPTPRHQEVLQLLQEQAGAWRRAHKGSRVIPDVDIRLGGGLVYRPDLAIFAPGRLKTTPERLDLPPDLVVEVLSPSSKATDMITKRGDYERFGVGEYWVIDPENGRARVWSRQGSQLVERPVDGQSLAASSLDGFVFELRSLQSLE